MERRQGNQHYRQQDFAAALVHYNNAISILEPLKGCAAEYQEEIDTNVVKAYLNIAALHLAKQYYGQAIAWCTKALTKDQQNEKALLRRAKAHVGRHNYQVSIPGAELTKRSYSVPAFAFVFIGCLFGSNVTNTASAAIELLHWCAECNSRLEHSDSARPFQPGSPRHVARYQSKGICREVHISQAFGRCCVQIKHLNHTPPSVVLQHVTAALPTCLP